MQGVGGQSRGRIGGLSRHILDRVKEGTMAISGAFGPIQWDPRTMLGQYGESEAILVHFGSILGGGVGGRFWPILGPRSFCRLCYTSGTILRGKRPLHPGWLPEHGILNFFESLSKSLILV